MDQTSKKKSYGAAIALILLIGLLLISINAHAQVTNADILSKVETKYLDAAKGWASYIQDRATWLFWTLAIISMVWTFGLMALRKADIGEFFAEFIRFIMFTGFFWWLLTNGPQFAMDIINSLRTMAGTATGTASPSPTSILDTGFDVFKKTSDKGFERSFVAGLVGVLMSLAFLVIMALTALNMLLLLISGWVLAYAGIFFLGFGGSKWTSDLAINYFRTVLSIAAQLMAIVLLIGIGKSFMDDYYLNISQDYSVQEISVLLVASITLLIFVNKIPPMIAGLATGGGIGSLGGGFGGGDAAKAGAAVAAAAIATTAVMKSGAKSIGGGAKLIEAAHRNSQQNSKALSQQSKDDEKNDDTVNTLHGSPLAQGMGEPLPASIQSDNRDKQSTEPTESTKSNQGAATATTHHDLATSTTEAHQTKESSFGGRILTAGSTLSTAMKGMAKESFDEKVKDTFGARAAKAIDEAGKNAAKEGRSESFGSLLMHGMKSAAIEGVMNNTTGGRLAKRIKEANKVKEGSVFDQNSPPPSQ